MDMLFLRPSAQEEALALLARYKQDAMIVAGGTDAVLRLTQKKAAPAVILSLDAIPGRHEITASGDTVRLASGVTYNELLASEALRPYRGLREAVLHLASPAIRAVATPVGNICTAAPAADCTTMLFALGASAVLVSNRGERTVPLDEFFVSTYKTVRESDELVTAIEIPALRPGEGTGYCRLSRRKAQDIGKILIGCRVRLEGGRLADASLSLGALNPTVVHASELESLLVGKTPEEALALAAETYPVEAKLRESYYKAYKQDAVCPAVVRALSMALADAKGEGA